MRYKSVGMAVVAALVLGLMAVPASANKMPSKHPDIKDAGVLQGTATVGKNRTGCANDGSGVVAGDGLRSEEHTSELQSLMRISYAVFCLEKNKNNHQLK